MAGKIITPAQAMLLPDCCFGQRFPVCVCPESKGEIPGWDISEVALPEVFVIWEMHVHVNSAAVGYSIYRLAIGDFLPTTVAEMSGLEPLFMGMGRQGPDPRIIRQNIQANVHLNRLRLLRQASGRRFVAEATSKGIDELLLYITLVVSSVPKEVPAWLSSGQGNSL